MQKNLYYLICGFIGILLVCLFSLSVTLKKPWIICVSFVLALVLVLIMRRHISDNYVDERQMLIDMKSSSATMKIGALLIITGNLGIAVFAFSMPPMMFGPMPHFHPPPTIPLTQLGQFALLEMALIIVVLFVYVGFRIYYTKKFGASDDEGNDEE